MRPRPTPPYSQHLARSLGFFQLTATGVGLVVGAGIYVLLGAATEIAGATIWVSFLLAGVTSALTAMSYAELASMFPSAAAEHEYTRRVAGPSLSFLVGWFMVAGLVVAAAAVSLGFASYLEALTGIPVRLGSLGLFGLLLFVCLLGVRRSTRLTVALSAVQVFGLVVIIAIGLPHLGDHSLLQGHGPQAVVSGAALVFFAFLGFDEVITLAEETTNPTRTAPRALLWTLGISTLLYVGVAISSVSVLGATKLGHSGQPLAEVATQGLGPSAGKAISVIAVFATINTTLLAVTAASRLIFGMAITGALPRRLSRVSRRQVPAAAIVVVVVVAMAIAQSGSLELVASLTDVAVFLVFIAVNVTVIALRIRQPHRIRPFTVPWSFCRVPVIPVLALVSVGFLLPSLTGRSMVLGAVVGGLGLMVTVGLQHRGHKLAAQTTKGVEMRRHHITEEDLQAVVSLMHLDIATSPYSEDELRRGMQVELQHGWVDPTTNVTNDHLVATAKIALVHLNEIPDYYTRLAIMEAEGRAFWKKR